jgi:hypothetical protein
MAMTIDTARYKTLAKDIGQNCVLAGSCIVALLALAHFWLRYEVVLNDSVLILGIVGTIFAFIGNTLVSDAVTRWGAKTTPQWKWGNRIQSLGFVLTIVALLIKTRS